MITEEYVSLKIAKTLKEKGFPTTKFGWSTFNGKVLDKTPHTFIEDNGRGGWYDSPKDWISCPTQGQVMKWLREVNNIHISLRPTFIEDAPYWYNASIHQVEAHRFRDKHFSEHFKTYEDACEAAIKYCLEYLI